jgi:hypothetical protein
MSTYSQCDVARNTLIEAALAEDAKGGGETTLEELALRHLVVEFGRLGEAITVLTEIIVVGLLIGMAGASRVANRTGQGLGVVLAEHCVFFFAVSRGA